MVTVENFKETMQLLIVCANAVALHCLAEFFQGELSRTIFVHHAERAADTNKALGTSRSQFANDLLSFIKRGELCCLGILVTLGRLVRNDVNALRQLPVTLAHTCGSFVENLFFFFFFGLFTP
jgi:hypothetical protein